MSNRISKLGTLALSSILAVPAMAQMDNTVEVETSVTPIVKDANKINVLPEVIESQAKHNAVKYSTSLMQTKQYVFTPVDMMSSETVGEGAEKGFVALGGGASGNLDLRGAYGINLSPKDVLGIHITLGGFNGSADNDDFGKYGTDYKSRFYTTRAGVDYNRKYAHGLSEFYIKLGLESQVFNYQWPFSKETDKQRNSIGGVSVGTTDYTSESFRVNGDFGFNFFNQKYLTNMNDKYSEGIIHANVDGGIYLNEENSLNVGLGVIHSTYGMDGVNGYTHGHFHPYYKYDDYDWTLKLGLFVGANGVAPDVRVDYRASEYVNLYAQAAGYDGDNSLKTFNAINPYCFLPTVGFSSGEYDIETEFHQLDAKLGLRFRSEKGWAGDINLGYDKVKNRAELTPISEKNTATYIRFVDGGRFYVNLDLAYNYNDVFKFSMKNQFNAWSVDEDVEDIVIKTRPVIDFDWNMDFRLTKGFFMGVDWKLQTFIKPSSSTGVSSVESYKRPATIDLGLSAHYTFSPIPLSIYGNVDNLFNANYDRFYGYRALGTNFIIGVAYTF